jgi:hypothetical protein
MKKLLFAIAFMTAGSVAVLAQEAQPQTQEPQTPPSTEIAPPSTDDQSQDQDRGQAIATSELPANIQAALQGQDYSGWTVASAFKAFSGGSVDAVEDRGRPRRILPKSDSVHRSLFLTRWRID